MGTDMPVNSWGEDISYLIHLEIEIKGLSLHCCEML